MNRRLLGTGICFLSCGLLFYQNCSSSSSPALPEHGLSSPFQKQKLLLTPAAFKSSVTGQSRLHALNQNPVVSAQNVVAQGTQLNIIVNDSCVQTRLSLPAPRVAYFIDKYVPSALLTTSVGKFDDSAISIQLKKDVALADLKRAVEVDDCIVGASNPLVASGGLAGGSYNDPGFASQQPLLTALNFASADSFFQTNVPSSNQVNVGVIDTGFDFANLDKGQVTNLLFGTDTFGQTDLPQDTVGHGTQVSSIITSTGNNGTGIVGLAYRNTTLIPIRAFDAAGSGPPGQNLNGWIFNNVKRAVNTGAEVVNLSFSYSSNGCDPLVGYAIYKGILNGTFFVLAAGQGVSKDQNGNDVPGQLQAPKENGPLLESATAFPGCWGRYYKGAITVGALTTGTKTLAPFSNWGSDAVEIAAPGTGVPTLGLNNQIVSGNGTSFAAAEVSSAVAMIIGFHKAKGWPYSPWLIEDILLNASPQDLTLSTAPAAVHEGRYLDMQKIADYLTKLTGETADQRRHEPSENPEDGTIITAGLGGPSNGTPIRLEVYSDTPLVNSSDRAQVQAVAYYSIGSYEVVTGQTTFSSSDPSRLSIDTTGVIYPVGGALGAVTVNGTFAGLSASYVLNLVGVNVETGMVARLSSLSLSAGANGQLQALANYSDGSSRDVSAFASFSVDNSSLFNVNGGATWGNTALAGAQVLVTALYHGVAAQETFVKGICSLSQHGLSLSLAGGVSGISAVTQGQTITAMQNLTAGACTNLSQDELGFHSLNSNTTYSSPQPQLASLLPAGAGSSFNFNSSSLPAGSYTINSSTKYYGATTVQTVTDQLNFTVVASPVTALVLTVNPTGNMGMVNQTFSAALRHENGTTTTLGSFSWQLLDSSGVALPSASVPSNWISPQKDGQGFYSQAEAYLFSAQSGDTFQIKVSESTSGLSATQPFKATGFNHYSGVYGSSALPSLATARVAPAPMADLPACSGLGLTASPFAGGSGLQNNPYLICTAAQLIAVGAQAFPSNQAVYFRLGAGLDLGSQGSFEPIQLPQFSDFDGGGRAIKNLTMIDSEKDSLALFAGLAATAAIHDLILQNPVISGNNMVGALSTLLNGKVNNVYIVGGNISGATDVGGLAGIGNGSISNTYVLQTQLSTSQNGAGGFFGATQRAVTIANSGAEVTINNSGPAGYGSKMGGLIGDAELGGRLSPPCRTDADFGVNCSLIVSSYAKGSIHKGANAVGGLVGLNSGVAIISSAAAVSIEAQGAGAGGLVGKMDAGSPASGFDFTQLVYNSLATGNVSGGNANAGGLIGEANLSIVENSHATGSVTGVQAVGGLIGLSGSFIQVYNSSTQSVTSGTGTMIGGFIGQKSALVDHQMTTHNVDDLYSSDTWSLAAHPNLPAVGSYLGVPTTSRPGLVGQ